jgi:ferritin-like metal-binding protein YciE
MDSFESLYAPLIRELEELYHAEMQLITALPTLDRVANAETLYDLLQEHLKQTRAKAQRLDRLFKNLKTEIDQEDATCDVREVIMAHGETPGREADMAYGAFAARGER